jgi:hypothetical protein
MPSYQHLDAYIKVNSVRVVEYDVSTDNDAGVVPTVSCWIPSEAGQVTKFPFLLLKSQLTKQLDILDLLE